MSDRVIQRHDTAARWQQFNPVLADGEIGIITDGAKGYKIGDGKTAWNSLPFPANPTNVVQETGDSRSAVMSQKAVSGKLAELESAANLAAIHTNAEDLTVLSFVNGDTNAGTGEIISAKYRVVTSSIVHTSERISLVAYKGFRFFLARYNSTGGFIGNTGWKTSYTIPAGTYFRIIIARETEDTNETANIAEFASSVKFTPEWYENVNKASNIAINSVRQISNVLFIRSDVRTTGELLSSTSRITNANIMRTTIPVTISIADGYRFYVALYNSDGTINKNTAWQTSEYTIPAGAYFRIIVSRATEDTSETIDVQEFVNALTNEPQWLTDIVDEVNNIRVDEFAFKPTNKVWNFINGDTSATTGAIISAKYRVVTKDICHVDKTTTLKVGNGFRFFVAFYTANGSYIQDSGWQTSEYVILAGAYFRVIIARVTENTSESASIELFTNSVRIAPEWYVDIIKKSKENPIFMACVTPRKVRYIQHRGMITEAPENSIPAFVESGKRGAFGVECDVITTSDNILVLMHDGTIDRTTNGTGRVADYTYEQLKQFRIDTGANLENYSDSELQIPLFEDYLKICKQYGMVALIEIKRVTATSRNKLVELLHHYGMKDSCMIMTYLESELSAFRMLDESINLTYLVSTSMAQNTDNVDAFVEKYKDMPNFGYTLDYHDFADKSYLLDLVRRIESYSQIVCMSTADTTDKENIFVEMFPDVIITDAGTIQ